MLTKERVKTWSDKVVITTGDTPLDRTSAVAKRGSEVFIESVQDLFGNHQ
jgi:hypothetical protein